MTCLNKETAQWQ